MISEHIKIGDVTPWIQYAGNGSQTQFDFSFPIFEDGDLKVYLGASETPETSGYAVAGAGQSTGGRVTFVTPPENGVAVTLLRDVTIKRVTDFTESGDFRASVINNELDRLTAVAQQLSTLIGRAVRLADTDAAGAVQLPPAVERAGKLAAFDTAGDLVAAALNASQLLVSSVMEAVLVAPSAAAARLLLGAQAQSDDLDAIAALTPAEDDALLWNGTAWTSGTLASLVDIRRLALDVAALNGDRQNMVDGIADPFADATDIDAAASTNEILVPSGYIQGLTETGGNALQNAKTGSNAARTCSATNPHAGIIWTQAADAVALGLRADIHAAGTPGDISARLYIAGANTIVASSGLVAVAAGGEVDMDFAEPYELKAGVTYAAAIRRDSGEYTLSTVPAPATDVTFSVVQGSDIYPAVTDVGMDASEDLRMGLLIGAAADLVLTSEAFTADAQPDTALIHVQVVENEAITINTDLIARVSRDDGATWTAAVLAQVGALADGTKLYEATGIDISGQPAGTAMRYQIETDNTKDIEIHGVVFQWGG